MLVLGRVALVSPLNSFDSWRCGDPQPCDPELARKHEVFFDQYLIEKQEEEGDRNLTGHVPISVCPSS